MEMSELDLVLVNPGGRERIYQELGGELAAIEPPLWCRLIAGYARDHGFSVSIIDTEALGWGTERAAREIIALKPKLIGMVVFGHQPSASTQQMVGAGILCSALKEQAREPPIIILGGHVSALPERTLTEEKVDYACKGEGPITVVGLLEFLKNGQTGDLAAIPGLVWRSDGEITVNLSAPLITDLDRDLHGNAWDLLPMESYRAHNWQCFGDLSARQPYASIYTSLGCPYHCSFCCINAPFGKSSYRMRRPERVVSEIDFLVKTYGVKTFKIIDEMFVLNGRHVMAICDLLIELGHDLNIWAYARVDSVKPHMLEKLKRAGIQWLALGIESGSKHVRDGAEKALKNEDMIGIVRQIQAAGIKVIGNYIFGLPDDTAETMRETLDLAKELNCEFANLYSAMAYPGSPLYRTAIEKGWALPDGWVGYSQHSYECQPLPTDTLTAAQVLKFRDDAFHEYFAHPPYLEMVSRLFGEETRRHVEDMAKHRLRRKLLEAHP
jgi:anaerobic magnesium-protoporphyrin IX monomethyl ester cyclase